MDGKFKNENVAFAKESGRETDVKIISETQINDGGLGDIFDTIIEIKGRQRRVMIKKYREPRKNEFFEDTAEERTKKAFENYSLVKAAGFKVFSTFRIREDRKSILMTNGHLNYDTLCIGSNNSVSVIELEQPPINEIENIDEFLHNFFADSLKAAIKGIEIWEDIYFFFISKHQPIEMDFVWGDLDNLLRVEPTKETGILNMEHSKEILDQFCQRNIDPSFQKLFLERVKYHFKQGLESVEKSTLK